MADSGDEETGLYLGILDDEINSFPALFPDSEQTVTFHYSTQNKNIDKRRSCKEIFNTVPLRVWEALPMSGET